METRVRSPLFDRLVDLEPRVPKEPRPLRALDLRGLRESVRRELERLLNTRSSLPVDRLAERAELSVLTVLEYGIPDLSAYSAGSAEDQGLLAGIIARAVTAFEPRLRGVKVAVVRLEDDQRGLRLRIDAVLTVDEVAEPVSFPMLVGVKSGTVEVQPLAD
jgi:type VI secretion system protein ImpF